MPNKRFDESDSNSSLEYDLLNISNDKDTQDTSKNKQLGFLRKTPKLSKFLNQKPKQQQQQAPENKKDTELNLLSDT